MFNWLAKRLSWLWSLWDGLPDETKAKVIRAFVDALEGLIRNYFRNYYREAKAT